MAGTFRSYWPDQMLLMPPAFRVLVTGNKPDFQTVSECLRSAWHSGQVSPQVRRCRRMMGACYLQVLNSARMLELR